jgi:peptidyl-prolyl cis-trans isomerase C
MLRYKYLLKALLLATALGLPLAAQAQEAPAGEDKVVAIVNGHEIKVSEVQMAMDDISASYPICRPSCATPMSSSILSSAT